MQRPYYSFTLEIDGQPMTVRYCPHYVAGIGHIEYHSPHAPRRPIPVSGTGYRSHFTPMPTIEAAPDVKAYARALALAIIGEQAQRRQATEAAGQLSLF